MTSPLPGSVPVRRDDVLGVCKESQYAGVQLRFPDVDGHDPLCQQKRALLMKRNMGTVINVNAMDGLPVKVNTTLDEMLNISRIMQLNKMEFYFLEDDDYGPFSPRNELEALNFIYSIVSDFISSSSISQDQNSLQALQNALVDRIVCYTNKNVKSESAQSCTRETDIKLMEWATKKGIQSKLNIAEFKDTGRGAIAMVDLNVKDIALEIPESLIISEDTAAGSDLGKMFESCDLITPETMTLLWSMKERHNVESKFYPYFAALPDLFNTGLSMNFTALAALAGTLLFEEILQAKEHLRAEYDKLSNTLFVKNKDAFPPNMYTWEQFLWACELWYSNSMKVIFPDGKLRTCLVPIAGLLNHSLYPHVMHYGRVDGKAKTLSLNISRPCKAGEQCYLSYGPLSNSHLITFYGFLLRENPYDTIPIELELTQPNSEEVLPNAEECQISHMIRGTWFSQSKFSKYGLPSKLLTALRRAFAEDNSSETLLVNPRQDIISKENEVAVQEALLSILEPMMDAVSENNEDSSDSCGWDVSLAMKYKEEQRRLLASVYESCSSALRELVTS